MGIEVGYFVVSRAFKKEFSSLNHEEFLWVYTSRERIIAFSTVPNAESRHRPPSPQGAGAVGTPKGLITTRTTTNTSP